MKRRFGTIITLVVGGLLLTGCLPTSTGTVALNALNADRVANARAPLPSDRALVTRGQAWAQHLLDASGGVCSGTTLSHSNLRDGAPAGWTLLGENVGCMTVSGDPANAVPTLEAMFMYSPGHRANILEPLFNRGGVGYASRLLSTNRYLVFTAQNFARV